MIEEIKNRRSIRKYEETAVSRAALEEIIQAGMLAPSAKNRQPWRFTVVSGSAKQEMLEVMRKGLEREKEEPFLPDSAPYLGGARHTLEIMRQAPVTIFIVNTGGESFDHPLSTEDRVSEICDMQSIGAAVENMTLTATGLGLGSLWICDTCFAQRELEVWLNAEGTLAAALSVGYAAEQPSARPRKRMDALTEWRD